MNIKRICFLAVSVILFSALSACGNTSSSPSENTFYTPSTTYTVQTTQPQPSVSEPYGFNKEMLDGMGLFLGESVPSDVIYLYGQPVRRDDSVMGQETVVTMTYDFGTFQFDKGSGDDSVLFYFEISSDIKGPGGIAIGMTAPETAERLYKGSSALVSAGTEGKTVLYDNGTSYGTYEALTQEFVDENCVYQLECGYSDSQGNTVKLTVSFNASGIATYYNIEVI